MAKILFEDVKNGHWHIENYIWSLADQEITEEEAILGIKFILQEKCKTKREHN